MKTLKFQISFICLIFVALCAWAVSSPVGSSPDDGFHLASIWCADGYEEGKCEPGLGENNVLVPQGVVISQNCYAFYPTESARCQIDLGSDDAKSLIETNASNAGSFYPPVYYRAMSFLQSSDITRTVLSIRLMNSALYFGLFLFTLLVSSKKIRKVLILSQVLVIVPFGLFIVASINPSSWAFTTLSFLWAIIWKAYDSEGWRRLGFFLVSLVLIFLATGARSDCAIWVGLTLFAITTMRWLKGMVALKEVLFFVCSITVMAYFFFSGRQRLMGTSGLVDVRPISTFNLWFENLGRLPYLLTGAIGNGPLGWMDTSMPSIVSVGVPAVIFAVAFQNLRNRSKRDLLVILSACGTFILAPLYLLNEGNLLIPETFQPRYFLPLIPLIIALLLVRVNDEMQRISVSQSVVVATALFLAHGYALHTNIRRYVTGTDVTNWNLNTSKEWWWSAWIPSPMTVWGIGALSFGLALVLCIRSTNDSDDRTISEITTNSVINQINQG